MSSCAWDGLHPNVTRTLRNDTSELPILLTQLYALVVWQLRVMHYGTINIIPSCRRRVWVPFSLQIVQQWEEPITVVVPRTVHGFRADLTRSYVGDMVERTSRFSGHQTVATWCVWHAVGRQQRVGRCPAWPVGGLRWTPGGRPRTCALSGERVRLTVMHELMTDRRVTDGLTCILVPQLFLTGNPFLLLLLLLVVCWCKAQLFLRTLQTK